jgi:hypothetical protein
MCLGAAASDQILSRYLNEWATEHAIEDGVEAGMTKALQNDRLMNGW